MALLFHVDPCNGKVILMNILDGMKVLMDGLRNEKSSYPNPWDFLRRYTSVMDELLVKLYDDLSSSDDSSGLTLVGVGGYGRRELSPWSDVDLMFLCRDTSSQSDLRTVQAILHALWDLHLEVGHSVRTIDDCKEVALEDFPTWTALMASRFVTGDKKLYDELTGRILGDLMRDKQDCFVEQLIQGVRDRRRKYARNPFLAEPHVKEGPGGLRDIQSALWLTRERFMIRDLSNLVDHALISADEAKEIQDAHTFLWRVRLALHKAAGRKEDHLTFSMREKITRVVLYQKEKDTTPSDIESFMREFYRHTTKVRFFMEDIIQKATDPSLAAGPQGPTYYPEELGEGFLVVRGRLTLLDEKVFAEDPIKIIEAVTYAHREDVTLDIFTRDQIKASTHLIDDKVRRSKRARDAFMTTLDSHDCGYRALDIMHRLGVLQAYLPEFGRICFQVQHDAYHSYTVDVHSLEAVVELSRLRWGDPEVATDLTNSVVGKVKKWPMLVLAVLFHDIGKGQGPGHAARGAEFADKVLARWRLPKTDRERVVKLVQKHLHLMDTAIGRDLAEEKVIADVCRDVGSVDLLRDLYLLTLADARATASDLLTDWKDQLLKELFEKTKNLLGTEDHVSPKAAKRIQEARELIVKRYKPEMKEKELERLVQSLPGRYLMNTEDEDLFEQVALSLDLIRTRSTLRLRFKSKEGYQELDVCTRDAPALFSRICGVLVAHGFNILGAKIHTWTNGIAMDTFQVESVGGPEIVENGYLDRVEEDLASVLEGKTDPDRLIANRAPTLPLITKRYPATRTTVRVDNRSSDFYSIVDVRTPDRFGLLFAITRTFAELGLSIHLAFINTRRGQAFDAFYVQDEAGQKVWDDDKLATMERKIYQALERMEESDPR